MTDVEINNLFKRGMQIKHIVPLYISTVKNIDKRRVTKKDAQLVVERAIFELGGGWLKNKK